MFRPGAKVLRMQIRFYVLSVQAPKAVEPLPLPRFDFVVLDSVVVGIFVGISLALSQLLQFERAYWVLVNSLAVIQGQSLRAVWNKQTQRILGTCVGLLLAWGFVAATGQVEYFADDHDPGIRH